ncbi:MAG: SEC-C metal-binding domain-containing protein [Blastocatellia bacterium]
MTNPQIRHILAFTTTFPGLTDRIITEVKLTQAFDPNTPPNPIPALIATAALWDTGATRSVITPSIAADLKLVPTGTVMMNSAHGSKQCNTYLVNLYLPNGAAIYGVPVSECTDTAHFGAIIGMDIIAMGDFSITNVNRKTIVSFRIPSIATVDYVADVKKLKAEQERLENAKPIRNKGPRVGRNDPCPCGSGKKYKKCCGG